jgi:hypothetical protein
MDHGQGPDGRAWQQRSLDSQRDDDRHHDSLSFAVREIRARQPKSASTGDQAVRKIPGGTGAALGMVDRGR